MNERIFREYDIRGIVETDLTDDVAYNLGRGVGTLMARRGHRTLTCGHDMRLSSPHLQKLFIKGLLTTGLNVINIAEVPTPALYYSIVYFKTDGGVMITGSHNPIEFNGFKISEGLGAIYGEDIQEIRRIIVEQDFAVKAGGTEEKAELLPHYIQMLKGKISFDRSLKIVVDAGNATAGPIAPQLWRDLGHEVVELYCEPDGSFPNHLPDPTVPEFMRDLQARVLEEKADLGLGYDGDADRVGAVDDAGNLVYSDVMLALFSQDVLQKHPGATIVFDVKCSQGLPEVIRNAGGKPLMWKTGHSLLKAKMREIGSPLAGEMSGHMFFADNFFGFDDGLYASGRLLQLVANSGQSLSQLTNTVPRFVSTPEIRVECADDVKFQVVYSLVKQFSKQYHTIDIDGARVQFGNGWGLVRASNTQPVLVLRFEAKTEQRLNDIVEIFRKQLQAYPSVKQDDLKW